MDAVLGHIRKNKLVYIIAFLFFIIKLSTISSYKIVWWDSAVYIGMGKYIYSLGNAGLWENSRPIVWSLILGFLWKSGFDVILFGRIMEMIFGSLCILLTYMIGKKIFDEKIGLLASIFLALSPTFFFFNGVMLTEIASTFFSLAAIYSFLNKKHFLSGIFFGTAFMTRFLQLFVLISILLAMIVYNKNKIKHLNKMIFGFILVILPYLILNQALYNDFLFPFKQQLYLSQNSGWLNYLPVTYYFVGLFKENFLYLLSIIGIFLIFKDKDANKTAIALSFAAFFILFNLIKQKEMRFLIVLFPYMYMLVSYYLFNILKHLKSKSAKQVLFLTVILSLVISQVATYTYFKNESSKDNEYLFFQQKLSEIKGKTWISNPITPVFSDLTISNLMYYPFFDEMKKEELISRKKPDFIFLDSCDLVCKPADIDCENSKKSLMDHLKIQLKIIYSSTKNQCTQLIFAK
ncbi:MAG: glycosyltransferase family 39 protein [Nanoarchaeota archaeon]|nr:glycosyltransferase family 39 protein [Nanoarchaeota archaeon]